MIRRSIMSILGGVALAAMLSLGVTAEAGCRGYCQDRIGNYAYAGCEIGVVIDLVTNTVEVVDVTCYYTEMGPALESNNA